MIRKANRHLKPRVLAALAVGLWMMSDSSFAACLMKSQQFEGVGTVSTLMLAPEREVDQYVPLGFNRVPCPTDMSVVRDYVERLCDGTGRGVIPALNAEALIGRPRERVCASARAGLAEAGG